MQKALSELEHDYKIIIILREIQELLGHASLSSTQIYTEINADELIKIYKKSHPRS